MYFWRCLFAREPLTVRIISTINSGRSLIHCSSNICFSKMCHWRENVYRVGKTQLKVPEHRTKMYFRTSSRLISPYLDRHLLLPLEYISVRDFSTFSVEPTQTLSVSQVKKILKNNNIAFSDGYTCLHVECPVCNHISSQKSDSKVYVNKKTGFAVCFNCGYTSHWDSLEKVLLLAKRSKNKLPEDLEALKGLCVPNQSYIDKWNTVCEESTQLDSFSDVDRMEILIKFSLPNVPSSIVKQVQVRVDKSQSLLYFPLFNAGGHVAGYKIYKKKGLEETVPSVNSGGLLVINPQRCSKLDTAVIVSSLKDALALASQKLTCSTICLPHGEGTLPQHVLPALERFKKLVLWFGNSVQCWDAARHLARKLGEGRCFFVRPTEDQPAPHEALGVGADLKTMVAQAKPIWHRAITTFSSLRHDVLAELQNVEKVEGVKWKRFPMLNKILKGHRRGEFTVLTGPTGSGKTTFMSEYSLDLASQGVTTLWGSFEIRNIRLARTMLHQLAGISFNSSLDRFEQWADEFEKLPVYFMTFHGQQPVRVVMEAVEHAAYVHDIAHVIIDNVQFMMGISEEPPKYADRFWKQDAIITAFRGFATRANCHVTLVMHPRKEQSLELLTVHSIFGSAKASQEADNVLIIQDRRLSSIRGKKYLQVAKNRYSGDLGVMPLEFDKDSLSFSIRKKKSKESTSTEPASKEK
ncbi:Uncharacterized protein GBIM_07826 [Gryllus bimaculatus]|nr:Uncharacterized protein GBIM_07826 [Gryllus bimaculatus]